MKPYRPANGTEGMWFEGQFCERCVKDAADDCEIHTAALVLNEDEDDYPSEWVQDDDDEPRCTAFEVRA